MYRYVREVVDVLAARAPSVTAAMWRLAWSRNNYAILDGTVIHTNRLAANRPFYSGKHRHHGVNPQGLTDPYSILVWISGGLPGAVNDTAAARAHRIPDICAQAGVVLRSIGDLAGVAQPELDGCARSLMGVLARLHSVDYRDAGLGEFGRTEVTSPGRSGAGATSGSAWPPASWPIWTGCTPDSLAPFPRSPARRSCTATSASTTPSSRPENLQEVRAIVDWEMATIGDPLADLGLTLVYRDPAFAPVLGAGAASTSDRMPPPDQLAEAYDRESARDIAQLDFYLALGCFKIAVIAAGIHARHRAGQTVGEGFETVGDAVPQLLAAGLRALRTPA